MSDISPLSGLTNLRKLNLSGANIRDISPLSGLTKIAELSFYDGGFSDISPLADMTNMENLRLINANISDISPLAGMTEIYGLNLPLNNISDLSPLAGLTQLRWLSLDGNSISDLAPLVANTGLDSGDEVSVTLNQLNAASINTHIPALQARGVKVSFSEVSISVDGGPQIYNDNVFVLPVTENLAVDHLPLEDYAARFYGHFDGAFDFLMIVSNLVGPRKDGSVGGRHYGVMNNIKGIGQPTYSRAASWGSAGKLQSVLEFTSPSCPPNNATRGDASMGKLHSTPTI